MKGAVVEFWNGVIDWFVSLWDELVGHSIVPDMIDAIVEWFLSLPKKIFTPVENFAKGIIERFKKMWADIQDWWGSKVAPKFTEEYWKKVFETISGRDILMMRFVMGIQPSLFIESSKKEKCANQNRLAHSS